MDVRLYVANLSPETTKQDLQTMFREAGTVLLVEVVMDPKGGRSRSFAFVTMPSQEEVEKAVDLFNECEWPYPERQYYATQGRKTSSAYGRPLEPTIEHGISFNGYAEGIGS